MTKINSSKKILINIYLVDISTLAIILDIRKYTAKLMDNTIIEMSKDRRKTSTINKRETITHFLLCKISIVNGKNATMVIKQVIVDCQNLIKKTNIRHNKKEWRKKKTECNVALYARNKECQGYIYSGCSKHITGYQSKFLKLNKKGKGKVTFGDSCYT
jgi:hypothetical protein